MFVSGPGKICLFRALNAERRNSKYRFSAIWKFFRTAISSLIVLGPRSCAIRRGVFPYVMLAGKTKAALLSSETLAATASLEFQAGLINGIVSPAPGAKLARGLPAPNRYWLDAIPKGAPLWYRKIADIFQFPTKASATLGM